MSVGIAVGVKGVTAGESGCGGCGEKSGCPRTPVAKGEGFLGRWEEDRSGGGFRWICKEVERGSLNCEFMSPSQRLGEGMNGKRSE